MVANSNSETIVKVAPTTIVSKKTPVTPLPTKPRQQNQVDLNSHQNQQNLQHQPLQNLSQQNHSLTNASDNSGVQVNIKYPILMQVQLKKCETAPYFFLLNQNLTCDCLLISVFLPIFD